MEVKEIKEDEIKAVVAIHKYAFKDFFLTSLGEKFLTTYYRSVKNEPDGLLLGAFKSGQLVGFCAACLQSKKFNTKLIQHHIFRFSLVGIQLLFTKPVALIRLFKNFTKSDPNVQDQGDYAELLSIAVDINAQGSGVGKTILLGLEKELEKKSCQQLSLTTDYFNNEKTIEFYKSLNYKIMYEFIAYPNRKMYRMIKHLNK